MEAVSDTGESVASEVSGTVLKMINYLILEYWTPSAGVAILLTFIIVHWIKTFWEFKAAKALHGTPKVPPQWPYLVPWIGRIAGFLSFTLTRDPVSWVLSSK